jgi:hypothetical protein
MEMDYSQAMEQLESMFQQFDRETIQTVLSSNDGHVERTVEDLIKLANEVENGPEDDNLFADPVERPTQNTFSSYGTDTVAKSLQISEDARIAYELQMKYLQQEERENQGRQSQKQRVSNKSDNRKKSPTFYKKVKVALANLFSRKGKSGKKGPTRNPGLYVEIEPTDQNNNGNALYQASSNRSPLYPEKIEDDSPMRLADVLDGRDLPEDDDNSPIRINRNSNIRVYN